MGGAIFLITICSAACSVPPPGAAARVGLDPAARPSHTPRFPRAMILDVFWVVAAGGVHRSCRSPGRPSSR